MKALVTGGTGFVGSHLVEALRRGGHEVTALVRSPAKARALGPDVRLVGGDLDATAALEQAAAGQDVIFHVAGLVAARSEAEFLACNRDGTANLLAAAARVGTPRFVLVSSMAAGGPARPGAPLRGDEPPRPVTQYGRSKLAAEEVVRRGPLPWTIVRPPTVYGPRDREVLKVFRLARSGVAPVFGDGTQELSAVYAPDLAEALIAAAASPAAECRIYYACHPEIVTSAEFARAVCRAVRGAAATPRVVGIPFPVARAALWCTGTAARIAGRATILTVDKANEFFQAAWTGDPSPLTRDTGWRAAHDLAAGLEATAAWYRAAGWL
ncbi:MAG TPA: NAD(P)-dependent oxidoreductase [Gemmatimonadales bacterium]|nr:NAD(P)-dependent oxidoreductase [Gemmatimonadales bacterium]